MTSQGKIRCLLFNRNGGAGREPRRVVRLGVLSIVLGVACTSLAWGQTSIANGGFEEVGVDGLPTGWHITKARRIADEEAGKVEIKVVEGTAHSGNRAIQLHSEISSVPAYLDQNLDAQGKGPLPVKGTISFWYKLIEGTVGRPAVTVLGAGGKAGFPGGFYVPVTFASDGEWHYAEMGYDLSGEPDVKSAFVRIYIMSFEVRYPAPTKFLVDDVKLLPRESTYFAPRLFHILEGKESDSCEARLYLRNMSLRPATANLRLDLPPHLTTDETQEKSIHLPAGPVRGVHMNDSGGAGVLKWTVKGRRRPGDVVAVQLKADGTERSWTWKRKLQPDLQIASRTFSRGLMATGEKAALEVLVRNEGDAWASAGAWVELRVSPTLKVITPAKQTIPAEVGPGKVVALSWSVEAVAEGKGTVDLALHTKERTAEPSLARAETWIDKVVGQLKPSVVPKDWRDLALVSSGHLFLSLGPHKKGHGAFGLFYLERDQFVHLASSPYLGKVIYLEKGRQVEKVIRYRPRWRIRRIFGYLIAEWEDADGTHWKSTVELRAATSREEIQVTSTLAASASREILAFQGPLLLVGDGSTGVGKDSAQFPGIEWLEGGEASSDHSHIPGLRDQRVPHPNKITVPAMGVVTDGKMVGLMWDPLQLWDGENDRPCALFDSPNRTLGEANHLMGLFIPSIPQWVEPSTLQARVPYHLTPDKELELRFSIIAADHANARSPVLYWHAKHGVPDPPQLDRTYDEELALSGLTAPPQMNVESTILQSLGNAEKAIQRQGQDGWWPWDYSGNLLNSMLNFTWAKNLDQFGLKGDTAIGAYSPYGSEMFENIELFRAARYTGDPKLVAASLRALQRAEQFKRPEGAQTWEQPLHTPDLLGSPYGVLAFLEGYKLTGDRHWLELSRWWATAGLPFIYVWGARDQPHMKYAGICFYGGSFLDYQLLGQAVMWVAMRYAESLVRLSDYDPKGPWKEIAQGILHNLMLQHEMTGEHAGEWPDWRDLIENRVLGDGLWYRTPAIGELLQKWLGEDPDPQTVVVNVGNRPIRITADGEVLEAKYQSGHLILRLKPAAQPLCRVAIAGVSPFEEVQMLSPLEMTVRDISFYKKYALGFVHLEPKGAVSVTLEAIVSVPE